MSFARLPDIGVPNARMGRLRRPAQLPVLRRMGAPRRGLGGGAIAGIVIGSIVLIAAVLLAVEFTVGLSSIGAVAAVSNLQAGHSRSADDERDERVESGVPHSDSADAADAATQSFAPQMNAGADNAMPTSSQFQQLQQKLSLVGTSADAQSRRKFIVGRKPKVLSGEEFHQMLVPDHPANLKRAEHSARGPPQARRASKQASTYVQPQHLSFA